MVTLTGGGGGGVARDHFSTKWSKKFMRIIFSPVKMAALKTNNFTAQSHFVSCRLDSSG